jgi:hypothetical protein
MRKSRLWAAAGTLLLAALPAPAKEAASYGDIVVSIETEPRSDSLHGYIEFVFTVANRSRDRGHRVTLTLPHSDWGGRGYGDQVRSVSRTVEVGPESTVRVALLVPHFPPCNGEGLSVAIDGRKEEEPVRMGLVSGGSRAMGRSLGGPGGGGGGEPLVLVSPKVAAIKDFFSGISPHIARLVHIGGGGIAPPGGMGMPGMPPGGMGMPGMLPGGMGPGGLGGPGLGGPAGPAIDPEGGFVPGGGPVVVPRPPGGALRPGKKVLSPPEGWMRTDLPTHVVTSEVPVSFWMTTWLGYSRYDGVVMTGEELAAAPESVQAALWQYAETGGSLLVLGTANVPASWKKRREDKAGMAVYQTGLGTALLCGEAGYGDWPLERWSVVADAWVAAASNSWHQIGTAGDANRLLRLVDDVGIPVGGLFTLMILFSVVIGPLNLWLLARKGKRLWLLWTVPSISFATCLAVFGFMLLVEGWQGHLRTEGVTILDENAHRATSLGLTGFYAPLTPGDGLHFSVDSEVVWQKGETMRYYSQGGGSSCTVDWSQDQHFASGWVSARVPSHFKLRKSEVRRERLTVRRRSDGSLAAVNGLGATILQLWLADDKGQVHTAEEVPAGAEATLRLRADLSGAGQTSPPLRELTQMSYWLTPSSSPNPPSSGRSATPMTRAVRTGGFPSPTPPPVSAGLGVEKNPTRYLSPRSYVAVLDGAPFFEEALRNARTRKGKNIVIGILKEADDAR